MVQMKKIPIEKLRPGMRFDKPVYIDKNNMLVGANISIREDDISKLVKWGIIEIETAGEMISSDSELQVAQKVIGSNESDTKKILSDYQALLKMRKDLIETHRQACNAVEKIHKSIKGNTEFLVDEVENISEKIIDLIRKNRNISLFLYGLEEGKDSLVVHSVNVTFYSVIIGIELKFPNAKLKDLALSTMLIDAGMLKMPSYITFKQSNLTEQEFNLIKTHPIHGYKLLKQLGKVKDKIAIVSLQHHEQFDGKGYPKGFKGEDIDEFARISSVADSYEAQISSRSYRKKRDAYHAMRNLLSDGTSRFDPNIMKAFLSRLSVYPVGSIVELNDNSVGLVVGSAPEKPLRPIIKLIFDSSKVRIEKTVIINLLEQTSLYITRALAEEDSGVNFLEVL